MLTDLNKSKTELPDLSNYVQMDEKNIKECKNNESHMFTMKISMKVVFIVADDNNFSTVVNGGDILDFQFLKN